MHVTHTPDHEIDAAAELSRKTIGQAIGLLMRDDGFDEDAALAVMKRRSAHANMKFRDLAAEMVE